MTDEAEHADGVELLKLIDSKSGDVFIVPAEPGAAQMRAQALSVYKSLREFRPAVQPGSATDETVLERMRQAVLDYLVGTMNAGHDVVLDRTIASDLYAELQQHFSGGSLGGLLSPPQRTAAHRPGETYMQRALKRNALIYLNAAESRLVETASPVKDVREAFGFGSEGTIRNWRKDLGLVAEAHQHYVATLQNFNTKKWEDFHEIFTKVMVGSGAEYQRMFGSKKVRARAEERRK